MDSSIILTKQCLKLKTGMIGTVVTAVPVNDLEMTPGLAVIYNFVG